MKARCLSQLVAVVVLSSIASSGKAQVTEAKWEIVPVALAGWWTVDLVASFEGQYTGAQLLIELTSGQIYQHPIGSALPPNQAFVDVFPELGYDTYLGQGSTRAGGPNGEPSPGGGAVDLGGAASAVFSDSMINQAWNPAGGVTIADQTDFFLARLTFSLDFQGTASVLVSAGGTPTVWRDIPIINPLPPFPKPPEPASMVLASLGILNLAALRRR